MRHSISIMFGEASLEALLDLQAYVLNYGDNSAKSYFASYLCCKQDKSLCISEVIYKVNEKLETEMSLDSQNCFITDSEKREISISNFFSQLYRNTINVENRGDYNELHISMYIPLYDKGIWSIAKELIDIINKGKISVHIDLIGLHGDIAPILCNDDETKSLLPVQEYANVAKQTLKEIISYKNNNLENIHHLFVIQNAQEDGVPLNLNKVSFTRIIGEFTLACIESYHTLLDFQVSDKDFQTFGLSMVSLDRYYFIQYLFTHVYLHTINRERVMQDAVDVNMAHSKTKVLVEKWVNIMSKLYETEIKRRIEDGKDHKTIIVELEPIISKTYEEIESDMKSFISDSELSIPEKKAILAALLGEDDELFKNITFDRERLIIHDIESEALTLYVIHNNLLLSTRNSDLDLSNYALLSENNEPVIAPLEQIKDIRLQIQESASTIRRLESENKKLEKQLQVSEEAKKVLIQDGYFEFGEDRFRLLPDDVIGEPLAETYVAHATTHSEVDLRDNFTPIKNQGQQGSCLAHAATSLFEYMLKSNKDSNPDLSEAFLYYNSREKDGEQNNDNGSRVDYAMQSLVEFGICTESMCKYDASVYNVKPSQEAYKDAESRKVKIAMNVNRTVEDLKSALEDGFPVGVSVRLTNTFGAGQKGFVETPSEVEIMEMDGSEHEEKKHGRHAMVVCGYSDKYKFFIVRNSWGVNFGDNGYCYMPYSYFENSKLFIQSYIIKEISSYKGIVINKDAFNLLLNTKDVAIKFAINKLQLDEELSKLSKLETKYTELQVAYESLRAKIKISNTQSAIIEGSQKRLDEEIQKTSKYRKTKTTENDKILEDDRKKRQNIQIALIVSIIGLLLIGGLLYYWDTVTLPTILYVLAGMLVCCSLAYIPVSKAQDKRLKCKLDEEINDLAVKIATITKERETIAMRLHIAGSILIKQFNLCDRIQNLYMSSVSLVNNLKTWYEEIESSSKLLNADSQPPFISILDNETLQTYVDNNIEDITKDIHIWDFLLKHNVSEVGITQLKVNLKQIVTSSIAKELKDFSIFKYIAKIQEYPFLPPVDLNFIETMDCRSSVFLTYNSNDGALTPYKLLMFNCSDDEGKIWKGKFSKSLSSMPSFCNIVTRNKIILFFIQDLSMDQLS